MTTTGFISTGSTTALTTGTAPNALTITGDQGAHLVWVGNELRTQAGSVIRATTPQGTSAKEISPRLYFKYVKSKLSATEQKELKKRISKLKTLYSDAKLVQQEGLAEELLKKMAITLREQEVSVCGYGRFVLREHIDKFRSLVKDRQIDFVKLETFPRPIPKKISETIAKVQSKGIFDEFWVLFFNPTQTAPLKTNETKIVEKDPILFGKFSYDASRYFYIVDWIDEYCDLTLDKFCEVMNADSALKKSYDLDEVCELSACEISRIKDEVLAQHERLTKTNRSNFLALAEEERRAKNKPSFFQRVLNAFKGR